MDGFTAYYSLNSLNFSNISSKNLFEDIFKIIISENRFYCTYWSLEELPHYSKFQVRSFCSVWDASYSIGEWESSCFTT